MADIENNSTQTPLPAFGIYTGKSNQPSIDYITIAVSFTIDVPGTLRILSSTDDINYHTFGDELSFTAGSHSYQVSRKLAYFKVQYLNGSEPMGVFELYTRILKNLNQDLSVSTNKDFDTITVFAPQTGFLSSEKDSITITGLVSTNLDKCITGNSIQVEIMNQSGLNNVNIFDSFGNSLSSTEGKLDVNATVSVPHLNYTTDSVSIGGTLPALTYARDAVNVSGSSVSVSGSVSVSNMISGFATSVLQTSTNTKLDTINTTITNKTNNGLVDSIQIYGSNGITNKPFLQDNYQTLYTNSVENSINDAPFDLLINGSTLWADSTPLGNPFFADLNSRQGWYYDNFNNIANISNIYWYANPTSGSLKENNMAFSSLGSMYAIITCDYVENGELTIPFMGVYSQATGSNDFIPGFAHSRWVFQLNGDNRAKLRKGETILIYTGSTRPNYHINLPAYPLSLASQSGDCSPLEIIAYMTVNTQATTSKIGYLLQYCGYMNSLIGFNREYEFRNSKERLIQNNLSASRILVDTGLTYLNVDIGITHINVSVDNFPSSVEISNGLTILNFPSSVEISNGLTILNFPSEISINNGLTILNFPSSVEISNGLTILNFSELDGLSVNTGLTGYALESTLQSIKLKTDLLSAGSTAFGPNIAVSVVNGVLVRSETYSGDGDSISATYNAALNKIGLDTTIVNANPITITCSNFPSQFGITGIVSVDTGITHLDVSIDNYPQGFKILDDNGNGLGYGTNPLIIDGTVSFPDNSFIGITGAVGITGGVHCMGYDPDTATYNNMYVDVDGVQRVEVVQSHIITAQYNVETDANTIATIFTSGNPSGCYSIDSRGRVGWHFDNILLANKLSWYSNSISAPPSLTFQKLQGLYMTVCFDRFPTNGFHCYMHVETTASKWIYQILSSSTGLIYPGETYLLYYGQKAYQLFPEIQNACKLEFTRGLVSGPGANNEVITSIYIQNVDETNLNVFSYLLPECGLYDQDRQNWFRVFFRNTVDFDANTNLSNLQLDSSNNLKTVSKTNDGSGNAITSTVVSSSRGLDTNILNSSLTVSGSVSISGTPTVSISGTPTVSLSAGSSVGITGTPDVKIYGSDGSLISSTAGLLNCRSQLFATSQTASIDVLTSQKGASLNALDVNLTAYNRTNAVYDRLTTVQPIGSANTRALECYSYNVGLNNASNLPLPITSTTTATTQSLDSYVNNPSTTVVNDTGATTTTFTGLNMYQIQPKILSYALNGYTTRTASGAIVGGQLSSLSYVGEIYAQFGKANARTMYAYTPVARSIKYDYVNSAGDLITSAAQSLSVGWNTLVGGAMISVNQLKLTTNNTLGDNLVITTFNSSTNYAVNQIQGTYLEQNSVMTCPNNAIMMITNINMYTSYGSRVGIIKWDKNGYRSLHYYQYLNSGQTIATTGGNDGFGVFTAGESICFGKIDTTTAGAVEVSAHVVIKYLY